MTAGWCDDIAGAVGLLRHTGKGREDIPSGYCRAGVSFALSLSDGGELLSVVPLKQDKQVGQKDGGSAAIA